ncbi:MAG: hypothetical protein IIB66_11125, partial [Proteobacteria bacterium]|nr:hypothetical protein [Pseudomonadota bacterium]
ALFREAEKESFVNSARWYRAFLATARGPGDNLRLYGLEDKEQDRPQALLLASWSPQECGPYGSRLLSGCHNVYTLQFSPLIVADSRNRKRVIHELVGALSRDRPRWDVVSFRMLDPDSDIFAHLLAACRDFGMVTEPYFQFGNWYEDIGQRTGYGAYDLAYDYMTRSGRMSDARLRETAPRFATAYDERRAARD